MMNRKTMGLRRRAMRCAMEHRVALWCALFMLVPAVCVGQRVGQGPLQLVAEDVNAWQRELLVLLAGNASGDALELADSLLRSTGKIEVLQRDEQRLVALLRGDRPGRRVALRAELSPVDSLQLPPRLAPNEGQLLGWYHAESALLLGAAKMLSLMQETLRGDVYFILDVNRSQACSGAQTAALGKHLQRVEALYSLALETGPRGGIVGLLPAGAVSPAEDSFRLMLYGRGGQGAVPERCADALVAGSALVGALQTLVSRGAGAKEATTLTVGRMEAGESARRVAGSALLEGVVYTRSAAERERVESGVRAMCDGTAKAYGVSVRCDYERGAGQLRNDAALTEIVNAAAVKAVGQKAVRRRSAVDQGVCLSGYASLAPLCMYTMSVGDVEGAGASALPYIPLEIVVGSLKVEVQLALEFLGRR